MIELTDDGDQLICRAALPAGDDLDWAIEQGYIATRRSFEGADCQPSSVASGAASTSSVPRRSSPTTAPHGDRHRRVVPDDLDARASERADIAGGPMEPGPAANGSGHPPGRARTS